jgi:hypothetical protein
VVVVDCMVWCDLVLMGIMVANNSVIEIMHFCLDVQGINHAAHVVPVYPHNALEYKPGDCMEEGFKRRYPTF